MKKTALKGKLSEPFFMEVYIFISSSYNFALR